MAETAPLTLTDQAPQEMKSHGKLYWFFHHLGGWIGGLLKRHFFLFFCCVCIGVALLLSLRGAVHPYVIVLRARIFLVAFSVPFFLILWRMIFHGSLKRRVISAGIAVPLVAAFIVWGDAAHQYLALYWRYCTIKTVEVTVLPQTGHERIQPLNAVHTLAYEAMTEMKTPMTPDFVRIGTEDYWTIGIEPTKEWPRFSSGVKEILVADGTSSSPTFSKENRIAVAFPVGEHLLFGRNSLTAVVKTMSPWRYFNYEPSGVLYMKDDDGAWVQVVTLTRWTGILFPQPEFGGVQIIRQQEESLLADLKLMALGIGEWIPPEEMHLHPFLVGQHALAYPISRYMADSFRYQAGFLAPFPLNHNKDIRIPDLEDDVNPQPFTVYFKGLPGRENGGLYHYFALEPYDPDKQGLNTALFVPADGLGPVYVYHHADRGETLIGVSAVSPKVKASRRYYDWNNNKPVEHRPFIHMVDSRPHQFWLTTIITNKKQAHSGSESHFTAGARPELVLTDAEPPYDTVWLSSENPENWVKEFQQRRGSEAAFPEEMQKK